MDNPINVTAHGHKIGPSLTNRTNCSLVKIHAQLQAAILTVEAEMETRIERKPNDPA